jgi:uncharacterized protein (DUF885 family)
MTKCAALFALVLAAACGSPAEPPPPAPPPGNNRAKSLADAYLDGYFERNPEVITYYGVRGRRHDRLSDNSPDALKAWRAKEDAWLREAQTIEPATIAAAPLKATYAIVRETLEGGVAARACHTELWNVSQMTGWHVQFGYLVTIQPVGTDEARADALARWQSLPRFIDTEIANLREGLRLGYSAPNGIVSIVIDQMNTLITSPPADSPFLSPAQRDKTPEFRKAWEALVKEELTPAFIRYRDFLSTDYLPAARTEIAVAAIPMGNDCYRAAVRVYSTLTVPPKEIHEIGLLRMDGLMAEMKTIAERSFGTPDVQGLLKTLRTDRRYMFKDREELIERSKAALARAKAAAPEKFGLLPKSDVIIQPYPKFREKNAPNEYNPPAEDGSRPAIFLISAYQAEGKSKAGAESTTFHETIPGHHLQVAIALERKEIHPIGRYLFNSGYVEGWALYAERLADEMNLYSSDLDRLGMLSLQAFRAARLVVDPGMHALGWTRQQAIDYMLAHTAEEPAAVASEIDRYISWPGQATSYMMGMIEIRRLREEAQQKLGPKFDIKAFHDRILEDGGVPLTFLGTKVTAWIGAS